ncbi:hypothetical protein [Methylobacterium sp. Leaf93]|uniref:hypothetical protein n=1 Tax=Methylobacterium sp. Leaf93 TaxID=1736249 RepID=UPI0012E9564D|nr:hypothetical protein [Methylobacterium sp. Leaf93]
MTASAGHAERPRVAFTDAGRVIVEAGEPGAILGFTLALLFVLAGLSNSIYALEHACVHACRDG